jgi:uncharacterized protein with gpF-like domain
VASKRLTAPTKRPIRLAPVRPNIGLEIAYQAKLDRMLAAMQRDTERTILAQWRRDRPEMAQDESPAAALRRVIGRLGREWSRRFSDFASTWSKRFTSEATRMTDRAFAASLKKAGFTVEFKMTREVNDIVQATMAEQVSLIKSIPAEYHKAIEGSVMRSVQTGRDMASLTRDLQHDHGVTFRRAATISRDQNSKATATITRARQLEVGITQASWLHSAGGKVPRPTHVANSTKPYVVAEGWLDPAINKRIWPGTEINCRCVSKAIISGL